jgi:hypothetical protein
MAEWSMNDWENAFGYAPESGGNKLNDDDIKGINEVKISSRLNRVRYYNIRNHQWFHQLLAFISDGGGD